MNEGKEIRFIDLYSGVGGFRRGLERANEERRILRRQDMHGCRTDADECLENGRKASIRHISQESLGGSEIGLERAHGGVGAKLTAGKGGYQGQNGLSSDFGGKDGNGREKHTDGYYRCVWSCDNDKYANQVYTKQFGEANHYSGDIRGIDPREIPDFDLLCAGFPCQSFSVAGKRKGFQDTRGTLFFEISRIAEAKRPQMLLLENVKGLLSNDRGQTFQTILQELGRIGYWAEWQVLNSKHHGVPQNRERVFIVGHLRGTGGREIFPIASNGKSSSQELKKIGNIAETGHDSIWGRVYDPEGIAMNVNAEGGGVGAKTGLYAIFFTNPHNSEEDRRINISCLSRAVKPPYGNQQPLLLENLRIRRLAPVECERLQGFPDFWTAQGICKKGDIVWTGKYKIRVEIDEDGLEVKRYRPIMTKAKADGIYPISDTQRYRALGNAVTTRVITFLGRRIMDSMGGDILDNNVNGG